MYLRKAALSAHSVSIESYSGDAASMQQRGFLG